VKRGTKINPPQPSFLKGGGSDEKRKPRNSFESGVFAGKRNPPLSPFVKGGGKGDFFI
jgi:hypothetical protein